MRLVTVAVCTVCGVPGLVSQATRVLLAQFRVVIGDVSYLTSILDSVVTPEGVGAVHVRTVPPFVEMADRSMMRDGPAIVKKGTNSQPKAAHIFIFIFPFYVKVFVYCSSRGTQLSNLISMIPCAKRIIKIRYQQATATYILKI